MPQSIPYQNVYQEGMSAQNDLGQSISHMVLGLALERQRMQQQQFLNSIRISELQRQAYLDKAHVDLFGQQGKAAEARGALDKAKQEEIVGLSKLAEEVQRASLQHGQQLINMSHVMDSGGPSRENAAKMNSLTDALKQSAAARQSAMLASTIYNKNAYQLMTPHNIPQSGTAVNAMGDVLGQGQVAPPKPFNAPLGSNAYMPGAPGEMPVQFQQGQFAPPHPSDPTAQLGHIGAALKSLDETDTAFTPSVSGGVTNQVPTPDYVGLTNWRSDIIKSRSRQQGAPTTNAPLPNIKSIKRIR